MKKYVISFLIFVSVLFVNLSRVEATNNVDGGGNTSSDGNSCEYGIICNYEFCGRRGQASDKGYLALSCPQNSGNVVLSVAYTCSSSGVSSANCDSFVSWAKIARNNATSYVNVNFGNYDEVFHNADYLKDKFKKSGSFSCPSYYVSLSDALDDDKYSFSFTNNGGRFISPNGTSDKKYSSQECINKNTTTSEINARLQEITTKRASDTSIDQIEEEKDFYSGDSDYSYIDCEVEENKDSIICSILNWGNALGTTKYDPNSLDPCDLINGQIQALLHNIFFFISVAGIIILVAMTAISLVKVITASEDEALRNFFKGLWKRIICLIILLILPTLVTFIIQLVNNVAPSLGIRSDNPLCNVTE